MPCRWRRVRYVASVDLALVVGTAVAGVVVGGVLDPLGQTLADRSRALEQRRRAEERADQDQDQDQDQPAGADRVTVRSLLPQGRSPVRTAAAAVLTGALFYALAVHVGADIELAPYCVFVAFLVAVSFTDLSHRMVPRWLVYGATALIVPLLVATAGIDARWHSLIGSAIGGVVAFGVFFAVWWFVPRGMGYGDVRLAGVIGIATGFLSLLHAYLAFLAGFVLGMLFGVVLMIGASTGRKTRIPFAPALAVGAVLAVFYGGHVAHSLFGTGG